MGFLFDYDIIICSIVRNAEKGLRHNIPIINFFCNYFRICKIVIYENDSVDNTKNILHNWKLSNPQMIHILSENIDNSGTIPTIDTGINPFFSYKRISKMASLRNNYLDYVERQGWNPDFLMIIDLDVAQLNLNGLLSPFERKEKWDMIAAYGYSTSPKLKRRYHDTYALCEKNKYNLPQTESQIHDLADIYAQKCKSSKALIPVDSAFGGASVYRYKAIKGLRYNVERNNDDRVEVRCEHYNLNRQMSKRGFDRIYIDPLMTLKYQSLTLGFILKKLFQIISRFKHSFKNK